jgi:hypothetical protein
MGQLGQFRLTAPVQRCAALLGASPAATYDRSVRPITPVHAGRYVSCARPDRLEEVIEMELIVTSIAATVVLLLGHFCIIVWNRLTGSR